MKKRGISRWQMVLVIVAVCFFVGVTAGAASSAALSPEQRTRLAGYVSGFSGDSGFLSNFIKHGKYIVCIWLCGFLNSGAAIILIIVFGTGLFYGFSASFSASERGMAYIISGILPQNVILIPLYIFTAVWSLMFVLEKFTNNGPKSRIKRERCKHLKEHVIILALCLAINAAACLSEEYIAGMVTSIL